MQRLHPFRFDRRAAIEAIIYVAQRMSDPTLLRASKVIYFADLLHLQRYGRFIFGDQYAAMPHGPVPSSAYNLMKSARTGSLGEDFRIEYQHRIVPSRDADLFHLSETDIECLNEAISEYGHLGTTSLRRKSHDAAYEETKAKGEHFMRIEDMAHTFENGDALLEYLELKDCE